MSTVATAIMRGDYPVRHAGVVLVREEDGTAVCIGQASHAWLSGQLARAWSPTPPEAVCLAAEQHDVGMAHWDLAPALDPQTGRPVSFMAMELADHLALWSLAPSRLLTQSRHAALLVSLHGTSLYGRRDLSRMEPAEADAVRAYLAAQQAFQERLRAELGIPAHEARADQERLFCWDALSLALCLGWAPYDAPLGLRLEPAGDGGHTLAPWPFAVPELTVACEGRRLRERCASQSELHAALERAEHVTLRFGLRPG